jgi:hypothetical protein
MRSTCVAAGQFRAGQSSWSPSSEALEWLASARGQERIEGAGTGEERRRRGLGGYWGGSATGVGQRSEPNPSRHRLDTGGLGVKWQDSVPIRCGAPLIYPVAVFCK